MGPRLTPRDAALPAGLLALGTAELAASGLPHWGWALLLFAVSCVLLVPRRRFPLISGCLASAVLAVPPFIDAKLDEPATPIAVFVVASYCFARYRSDLSGLAGLGLVLATQVPRYVLIEDSADITDVFFVGALLLPPFFFGRITRRLDDQARRLEEQQAVIRTQAARDERARIARELHDVIAHSISAMVVQTSAARDLVDRDPERAKEALDRVASAGRGALAETARLLHLIRDDADELGLEPVPGLADLDRLVADGGVELERSGDLAALPAAVDVSAYRICQEAVTNGRRYGQGPVSLAVARHDGTVRITASNAVGSSDSEGGGLGLLGMAERASVLGGRLTHGVRDGRFELEAVLPVADA